MQPAAEHISDEEFLSDLLHSKQIVPNKGSGLGKSRHAWPCLRGPTDGVQLHQRRRIPVEHWGAAASRKN